MSGFFNSLKSLASGAANAASSAAKYQGEEGEDTRMRFSLTPQPGESGFTQWLDAMKMVARLQGGIPPEFRKRLWLTLAERHLDQRGVDWKQAEKLCFNEWSNPDDEELGIQIVKDLHRTGCSLFCGAAGRDNQAVLRRVLLGFARWNKSVGYCQGLNVLAALVLQVTDRAESSAVKVMIYLIEGVLPEGYFADNLRGLSIDMAVFRDLLRMRLPKLSRHLEALQSDAKDKATGSSYEPPLTNVFTMQWFLTLFCHCLPQEAVLRVWDLIFLEGDEVLLRTALAIWEGISDRIMTVTSADEFYSIMGVLTREMLEFTDVNNLIKTIVNMGPLYGVTDLREKHRYNITPWARRLSDEEDTDTEEEERMAVAAAMFGVSQRFKKDRSNASSSALQTIGPTSDRERLALDISTLKHQYAKLRERQRQAHIILSAACARQSMVPSSTSQAMNHLLVGKSALVSAKTRQLGPPPGAIPPKPRVTATIHGMRAQSVRKDKQGVTLHWKDTKKSKNELEETLEKGKRYLERSYDTRNIETTDGEDTNLSKEPVILSGKTVKKSLQDVPTMFSSVQKKITMMIHLLRKKSQRRVTLYLEYLNNKFHQLEISINSNLGSIKRSLLYDIEMKTTAVKNTIIANATSDRAPNFINCSEARAGVGSTLPIKNLDDFLKFDAALKNDEKRKALMTLYRVLVSGISQAKDCISKIIVATITKSVELHYSGTGCIIKNVGKKNFSATATYGCLKVRDETETPSSMVDSPETMSSSLTSPKRGSANDSDSDSTSTELCDEPDRLSDVDSEEPTSTSDCYVMATDDEKSPRPGQSPVIGVTPSCQFPDENSSDRHDAAYLEEEGYQKDPENNSKQLLTVEGSSSSIAMITDQIRRLSASDDNNLSPVSHVESVELDMKELDQKVGCGSEGADIGTDRTLENATRIVKDLTMLPVIPDTKESTQDGFCAMEKNFESLDRYNFSINSDNSGISETLMDSAISSATEYHEVIAMPVSSVATKNTDGSTDTIVNFGTANLPLNIETTRLESSSRETNDIFNYESTSISRASPEKTSLRLTDLVLSKCSKYENSISIASLNDNPTEKNIIERTFHPRSYVIGHLPISPTTVDDKLNTTCKIPPSTEKVRILKPETDSFLAGTSGSLDTNSKCIAQASISKENTDSSESLTKNNCPLDNLAASKRDNETCTSVSKGITSNETFSMNKRVPDTLESFSATSKPNDSLTYSDTSRQITQSLVNEPEVNVPKFSARSMTGKSERETRDVSSDYDFDVSINTISSEKNISQMIEKTVTVPMNEIPMTDTPSPIGSEVKTSELSSNYVYQDAMLTKFYEDKKKSPKTPESGKSYSSGETMGPDSRNSSLATSPRSITTDSRNILMDKSARSSFSSDSKTLTLRSLESESGVHNKTKLDIKSDLTRPSLENSSPSTPISTDSLKNKSEISPKFVISSSSESCSPGKANKSSERSFSSELQSPVSANSIKYRTNYADGQEHLSESPLDICSATSPFYPIVNPNQKTPSPYSTTEKQSTNGNSEETSPEQRSTGSKEEGNSSKYNVKSVSSGVTRCSDLNKSSKNNDEYDSGRPFEKELAETLSSLPCDKTKSERITSSHYREGSELDSYRSKEIVVEEKEDMEERYIEMDTVSPLPRDKYDANRPAFVDKSGSFKGLGLSESDGKYSVNTRENLKPFERSCSSLEKRFGKLKCSPSVEELIVDTHKKRSSDILQDIKHLEEKTLNDGTADTSMLTRKTGYGWEDLKNLEARRQDNFSDSASEFSRGRPDPSRISVFTEPRKSYVVEPKIDLDEGSESILKNYARKKSNGEPDDDSESKIGVWTKVKPRAGRDNGRRSSDRALKIIQENSAILHKILTCQAKKRLPDLEEISKEITISPINEEISKIFSPILEKMGLNEHEINEELARINFKDFDQMTTASGSVSEFDAKINDELSKLSLIDDTEIVDNMAVEDVISRDYLDTREALIDRQINEELSKLLANYEKDSPICVVGNRDEISSCQNPSEIEALDISSISTNVFSYPSSNESMEMKTDLDPMQDTGISGDKFSQYSEDPMMKFGKPSKYSLRSMSSKSDIDIYQELEKLDKISSGEILPSSASIIPQKIISPMSYPSECPVYPEVHPSSIDYSIKPADKVFESSPMKSPYDTYKPYDFKSRISPRKTPSNPYSARSYDKPAMDDHFDFHENPTSPSSLYDLGGTASSLLTKETLEFRVRYEDETSKAIRNDDFTLEPYHSSLVDFDRGASYYSNESPVSLKRLEAERNLEQTIVSPLNCSYKPPDLYTQKYDSASPKNYSYLKNPTEYETSYKVDEESVEAGSYLNPRRKNSHSLSPSYQYDARDFSASINHPYGTELSHNLDEASKRTFFHSEIPETMSQLVKCPENATSREALNYRKASLSLGPLDGTSTRISTCLETTPTPKSLFSPFPIRNSSRKPKELGLKLGLYSPSSPSSNPLKRS